MLPSYLIFRKKKFLTVPHTLAPTYELLIEMAFVRKSMMQLAKRLSDAHPKFLRENNQMRNPEFWNRAEEFVKNPLGLSLWPIKKWNTTMWGGCVATSHTGAVSRANVVSNQHLVLRAHGLHENNRLVIIVLSLTTTATIIPAELLLRAPLEYVMRERWQWPRWWFR